MIPWANFPNDWIENIVPYAGLPKIPQNAIVLFGYIHDEENHAVKDAGGNVSLDLAANRNVFRLYLTLELNDYLVVPATAIIHAVSVTGGFFTPVDGTLLWVKPEA